MSTDGGQIEYTVSADTSDLLTGEKAASTFTKAVVNEMNKADKAVEGFTSELTKLGKTVTSTGKVINSFGVIDKEATKQLKLLTTQSKLAGEASKGVNTGFTKAAAGVKEANSRFSLAKGGMTNVSYQMQDIIVQSQMMGTSFSSMSLILGQQLPQLLGSFGGIGAGVGVVVALLGALGPAIAKAFTDGGDAVKEYEKAIDRVNAAVTLSTDGTAQYTDQVNRLAKFSKSAAASMLSMVAAQNQIATNKAAENLVNQFKEVEAVFDGIRKDNNSSFLPGTAIQDFQELNAATKATGQSYEEAKEAMDNFKSALNAVKLNPTKDSVNALLVALDGMKANGQFATEASIKLAENTYNMADAFIRGAATADALQGSINSLGEGGGLTGIIKDEVPEKIKEMENELKLLAIQIGYGGDAAQSMKDSMDAMSASKGMSPEQTKKNTAAWLDLAFQIRETGKTADEISDLSGENDKLANSLKGASLEQQQMNAVAKLGANATEEQIRKTKDLVEANYNLTNQQKGVNIANSVTTSKTVTTDYNTDTANLNAARDADLISHEQYIEAKKKLDSDYATQYLATNSMMSQAALSAANSLASGVATAFSSIASGTASAEDAMRSLAQTIIQSVLQSVIQTGVQYAILPPLARAFGAAQAEASATAASASIAASTSTAAATSASAGTVAAASAPAAAATATWSFGTAAIAGAAALGSIYLLSKTLSGNRRYGGAVSSGNSYQINESGVPEVYSSGGSDYLMATSNAKVTPLDKMGGDSSGMIINVNNYASDSVSASVSKSGNGYDINIITKQVGSNLANQVNNKQGAFYKSIKGAQ